MPAIPVSQIPNAPQAGAPVLSPTLPGIAPLQPINLGQGFDTSGLTRAQSLVAGASDSISRSNSEIAQATAGTKRGLIDDRPFTAEGRALQFAGEAITHAGNVAIGFGDDMLRAKESIDMTRVDAILRNARDQHQLEVEQNQVSPDQWVPSWNDKQGDVQQQISDLKISHRIKGQVTADVSQFWGAQTNRFALAATERSISDAREEAKVNIDKMFSDGDLDSIHVTVSRLVESKIFSNPEGEQILQQVESKQRDELVNTAISADPKSVLEEMEASKESGKSSAFPWLDAAQRIRVEGMARAGFRQQQSDAIANADESILSGEFTTPEQVEEYGLRSDLDKHDIESLKQSLAVTVADTPQAQAKYQTSLDNLWTQVAAYDPSTDPDEKTRRRLWATIRQTAVEGDRQQFQEKIQARIKSGMTPNDQLQKAFFSQIDDLGKQGLLGATGVDEKGKITDPQASLDLSVKAQQYKARVTEFLSKNPGISPDDAKAQFQQIFTDSNPAASAAKAFEARPKINWPNGGWFQWKNTSKPPATINQQIDQKLGGQPMSGLFTGSGKKVASTTAAPSFLGQKGPASIRYNNPGAMYPGPSSKKFGSTETETIGGGHKIAVFPDAVSGAAAQIDLLHRNYTGKTLQSAITKWSGGNDVPTYLKVIQKETGLSPDTVLTPELIKDPKVGIAIARAMALQEAGKSYPLSDDQWLEAHKKAFNA